MQHTNIYSSHSHGQAKITRHETGKERSSEDGFSSGDCTAVKANTDVTVIIAFAHVKKNTLTNIRILNTVRGLLSKVLFYVLFLTVFLDVSMYSCAVA